MLSSTTKTGSKVRQVIVEDYLEELYSHHMAVYCDGHGFVLGIDLELVGTIGVDGLSIEPKLTATRLAILEQKYGFLKVVKAFVRGSRGVLLNDSVVAEQLPQEEMYAIFSPYVLDYLRSISFSKSDVSSMEIRASLYTLVGSIVVDLKPDILQTILQNKGDLSLTKFLLESLQKCSVLYIERNPITY